MCLFLKIFPIVTFFLLQSNYLLKMLILQLFVTISVNNLFNLFELLIKISIDILKTNK